MDRTAKTRRTQSKRMASGQRPAASGQRPAASGQEIEPQSRKARKGVQAASHQRPAASG
ncbi:AraC family transcriptional regulator [Marichromatium sp. AB32]|nr:AraC family transcriptional regulator [Marichromatium sp. AB32]